jgi:hypothetical protein
MAVERTQHHGNAQTLTHEERQANGQDGQEIEQVTTVATNRQARRSGAQKAQTSEVVSRLIVGQSLACRFGDRQEQAGGRS